MPWTFWLTVTNKLYFMWPKDAVIWMFYAFWGSPLCNIIWDSCMCRVCHWFSTGTYCSYVNDWCTLHVQNTGSLLFSFRKKIINLDLSEIKSILFSNRESIFNLQRATNLLYNLNDIMSWQEMNGCSYRSGLDIMSWQEMNECSCGSRPDIEDD